MPNMFPMFRSCPHWDPTFFLQHHQIYRSIVKPFGTSVILGPMGIPSKFHQLLFSGWAIIKNIPMNINPVEHQCPNIQTCPIWFFVALCENWNGVKVLAGKTISSRVYLWNHSRRFKWSEVKWNRQRSDDPMRIWVNESQELWLRSSPKRACWWYFDILTGTMWWLLGK